MKRIQATLLLRFLLLTFALSICSASWAQKEIRGTITDETGMTLPGVNVIEKGTTNGTITDLDGNFSLTIPEDATVQISYIGYGTVELTASSTSFNVVLKENTSELEEVVVVGYQTMKKGGFDRWRIGRKR